MTKLPQVSGQRIVRALLRAGFIEVRQTGGHASLRHGDDPTRRATVALHGARPVPPGTLRAILRGARLSTEELNELL